MLVVLVCLQQQIATPWLHRGCLLHVSTIRMHLFVMMLHLTDPTQPNLLLPVVVRAGSKAVGLELRAKWVLAAVKLARQEDGAWRNPTMQLMVQPLGFL